MKYLFYCLLTLLTFDASAQHISGLYTGKLTNDSLKMVQDYQLALSEYKGKITGYSYITFVSNDTFYYGIKRIKARRDNGNLIVEDVAMLANNYPVRPAKGVHVTNIIPLPKDDTLRDINGKWETNQTKRYYGINGGMEMQRDNDSSHSALINHLKELNIIDYRNEREIVVEAGVKPGKKQPVENKSPATVAAATATEKLKTNTKAENKPIVAVTPPEQRKATAIETIAIKSDSLVLSFYDNGVVDGDTISVFLNDKNIISRTKLTEAAVKKVVYVGAEEKEEITLTLVAENLGTIPPNTGLLIIQDGDQKHQIRFSADMQTNAAIILRKQKAE